MQPEVCQHSDDEFADVVVIGAGPAGLAAALAASRNGAKRVLVLESRQGERRRNNVLLLDAGIIIGLQGLGVDVSRFTPATDFTFIDADAGHLYQFPLPERAVRLGSSVLGMFPRRTPGADVLISELENALLEVVASQPGIHLCRGVSDSSMVQQKDGWFIQFDQPAGVSKVRAGIVAVCDGANSRTLDQLGISRTGEMRQEVAMVANFLQAGRGQIKFERADRSEEVLALCSMQGTTITVRMPMDTDLSEHADPQQRIAFMRDHARKVGVDGDFITEPKIVEISHDRAERCQINGSVFVLGDAARTATPRLGLGVNWAIRDALRFGSLLPKLQHGNRLFRCWGRSAYALRTRLATEVLLFQGWMLKCSDQRVQRKPRPAAWRFRQKSLLMRFMWRASQGALFPYHPDKALASILYARDRSGKATFQQ